MTYTKSIRHCSSLQSTISILNTLYTCYLLFFHRPAYFFHLSLHLFKRELITIGIIIYIFTFKFFTGLFFVNPTEIQKFSISSEFMRQLPEMRGRVFTKDIPMPEPPKQGFLKGASSLLFGGGPKPTGKKKHVHFTKKIGPHISILFPVHTPFILLLLLLQIEMNSLGNMLAKRNQEWPKGQAEIWFRFKPMLPGEHPKCPKPKMQ